MGSLWLRQEQEIAESIFRGVGRLGEGRVSATSRRSKTEYDLCSAGALYIAVVTLDRLTSIGRCILIDIHLCIPELSCCSAGPEHTQQVACASMLFALVLVKAAFKGASLTERTACSESKGSIAAHGFSRA